MEENGLQRAIRGEIERTLRTGKQERILPALKFLAILYNLQHTRLPIQKRSVYYLAPALFKSQARTDALLRKACKTLKCGLGSLYIRPSLKGLFWGAVRFRMKSGSEVCLEGRNIIPDMESVASVECQARHIVVLEKDTLLHRVADSRILAVCGKGFPCTNTLRFLQAICGDAWKVCLTDFDPHGFLIYMQYKKAVSSVRWLGLSSDDLLSTGMAASEKRALTAQDARIIDNLRSRLTPQCGPDCPVSCWHRSVLAELDFMTGTGAKFELEAVLLEDGFRIAEYLRSRGHAVP